MKRLAASFATLALAAGAAGPLSAEGNDEPEVFAAVFELHDDPAEYDGYYCPPAPDENSICLGASILIQKGEVVRYLGAEPPADAPMIRKARGGDVYGDYLRFRMITGHAVKRVLPGRFVAVLEPTDNGYIFVQWKEGLSHGRPCLPDFVVEHYGDRLDLSTGSEKTDGSVCF